MNEIPNFDETLRNPDVPEEADRELDKAMDSRMAATAARRIIPEFASLEQESKKTPESADANLAQAQAAQEKIDARISERHDIEGAREQSESEKLLQLLKDSNKITGGSNDKAA